MNKENRKLAQQKRAEEREKRAQQEKTKEILKIVIPTVLILALVIWVIVDYVTQGSSSDTDVSTEATTEEAVAETTESDDIVLEEDTETAEDTLYTGTDVAVADGDTVNIDYVGSIDGVEFSGGTAEGADLTIGSGMYIDDFEDQLIGHYVGETVDVNVTFPEDYGVDELNGQDALFEVTINGIYQSAE